MATAQFITLGPFFDAGVEMTSAKLYHYEIGSTTLKNIWSDRSESTTLAQPFVSDANGVFAFFADGLYKLVIADSSDVVKYTWDNVNIKDFSDPTLTEGTPITSSSTIAIGPEIWTHITGTTNIDAITGTIPFTWLVFDGSLTLNYSANLITPGGASLSVQAGDVVFLLNEGSGIWRVGGIVSQALLVGASDVYVNASDSRTNSVDMPLTVTSQTTGTPASGIGVGALFRAESQDEAPSNFGAIQFTASDITTASEDTFMDILIRVAGAALATAYRFISTGAYKATLYQSNTSDRTYILPDRSTTFGVAQLFDGPTSIGSGSTRSLETFTSATGALSGVHFYTGAFTLNNGHTLTLGAGKRSIVIISDTSITINGAITTTGGVSATASGTGMPGTDQPGGGGAGGAGGDVICNGCVVRAGGAVNTAGTQVTGSDCRFLTPMQMAGACGAASGGDTGSGAGGGSIVLIAPLVTLGSTAVLTTSGSNASGGSSNAGGGGAGNVYIATRTFSDAGATFTQTGGAGEGTGGAGAAGIKQILVYI